MDSTDRVILSCLRENARISASEISARVGLSVSSVGERIRKLERSGAVEKYTVVLNPARLNRAFQAMIGISVAHPRYIDSLSEAIMEDPNVVECYTLTGDVDYMARVSARSPEHFQQIHRRIARMDGVKAIKSYYILETSQNPRFDPLSETED